MDLGVIFLFYFILFYFDLLWSDTSSYYKNVARLCCGYKISFFIPQKWSNSKMIMHWCMLYKSKIKIFTVFIILPNQLYLYLHSPRKYYHHLHHLSKSSNHWNIFPIHFLLQHLQHTTYSCYSISIIFFKKIFLLKFKFLTLIT